MTRLFLAFLAWTSVLVLTQSCVAGACADGNPSLQVLAEDALSGAPISKFNVEIRDGDFSIEVDAMLGVASGPFDRPGVYSLEVSAEGYETQSVQEIHVDGDSCVIIGETILVQLVPSEPNTVD